MKSTCFRSVLIISLIGLLACENTKKNDQEEPAQPRGIQADESSGEEFKSDREVKAYLEEIGVLMSVNGRDVFREDNLKAVSYDRLTSAVATMRQTDGNETAIFYLTVAGASLDDSAERKKFIEEQLIPNDEYLPVMDKMVKFSQRQERPVIQQALENTVAAISPEQCLEFLKMSGYVQGDNAASFTYNVKVLKTYPMFFRIALLDKLRNQKGDAAAVFDQMAADLGLDS